MTKSVFVGAAVAASCAAAAISLALLLDGASKSTDPASPAPLDLEARLGNLERAVSARLDRIEARLSAARLAPRPSSAQVEEGSAAETAEKTESDTPDATFDGLEKRVATLEERVRGLEQDPIQRGYAFLESESDELRRQGVRALARVARMDPEARAAIRRALADASPLVRREALEALGNIRDKESVPSMVDLLADSDEAVRRRAISALEECEATDAAPSIAQLLSDPADRIRVAAADALGVLKSADSGDLLLKALQDSNDEVRGEAIASLGEAGVKSAIPALRRMYEEGASPHRTRLLLALRSLGDEGPIRLEIERLSRTALVDPDERVRSQALRALGSLARGEARPILRKALEDPSAEVRREAERLLR